MGGFEKMFETMKPTGNATRETGEEISWRDVDREKLTAAAAPAGGSISFNVSDERAPIPVHDGKSPRLWGLHTTKHVRSSLIPQPSQPVSSVDYNAGFSEAFKRGTVSTALTAPSFTDNFRASWSNPVESTAVSAPEILGGVRGSGSDDTNNVGQIL